MMEKELILIFNIVFSAVLGFLIGLERKFRSKEAGIRTHTVVCIGAALMTVVSKYGFADLSADGSTVGDPSRIAAQVVTGIGFLGAGMIVYRKNAVHGLTTAAGVWATAGVGLACGAGMYLVAAAATAVVIGFQALFHLNVRLFRTKKTYALSIVFEQKTDENRIVKELFRVERFNKLQIRREDGKIIYSVRLVTENEERSEKLCRILQEHDFIRSIERVDED